MSFEQESPENEPRLQLESVRYGGEDRPPVQIATGLSDEHLALFGKYGEYFGVVTVEQALRIAREQGLKLFLIRTETNPKVARLLDLEGSRLSIRLPSSALRAGRRAYPLVIHVRKDEFKYCSSAQDVEATLYSLLKNRYAEKLIGNTWFDVAEKIWELIRE